jgi:hypothetical protein
VIEKKEHLSYRRMIGTAAFGCFMRAGTVPFYHKWFGTYSPWLAT